MFINITGTAAMIAVLCVTSSPVAAAQSSIPNSVCRGEDVVTIRNTDLKTDRYRSTDLYRFVGGKLFVSSEGREEHFYNDVRPNELLRHWSKR